MAAIRPAELQRFIASGCRGVPLILVFGPDEGAGRTRIRALTETLLGKEPDPLMVQTLEAETINDDPARLLDEANAIGMFGGRRVIIVQQAGKLQKAAWQALLETPPMDSTVLFQADDLAKTSPLRVAFEQNPRYAAIACYAPSRQDLQELIDLRMREAGLSITPAARAYLADLLGTDLALSEMEIEKLVLYCRGGLAVEVDDIDAAIADASDQSGSEPIDRAFEGKLEEIEAVALRSFREGINASAILALALNHAMMLKRLVNSKDSGGIESAMRAERIFYKRQDRVRSQIRIWDHQGLVRAIETLATAQDQARRTAALEDTVTIRALWSIALAARRR